MAMIAADALGLLVGDGAGTETFTALKGARITRLEVTQKSNAATAVAGNAWVVEAGASGRRATIECEAYATDDAPALRVRMLALGGGTGNFRLKVNSTQTVVFAAIVTSYREMIDAGEIKRLHCRLESSGVVSVV